MAYRPGENVHWIQAKKAVNDTDSWHGVDIVAVDGAAITVAVDDGRTITRYCIHADKVARPGALPSPAAWCERWHVLATRPDDGMVDPNSFATGVGRPRHVEILGTANVCLFNLSAEPVPAPYAPSS